MDRVGEGEIRALGGDCFRGTNKTLFRTRRTFRQGGTDGPTFDVATKHGSWCYLCSHILSSRQART